MTKQIAIAAFGLLATLCYVLALGGLIVLVGVSNFPVWAYLFVTACAFSLAGILGYRVKLGEQDAVE